MYVIIDVDENAQIGIVDTPKYVRIGTFGEEYGKIIRANEIDAQGIIFNDEIFNLESKDIGADRSVRLVKRAIVDTTIELVNSEERHSAYIDYLSAMTGIDLPDEV